MISGQSGRRISVFVVLSGLISSLAGIGAAPALLPVYIEDSHAGSFYWLAENIDLERAHTLLLFDAHSDASAIFDSDDVRRRIRRVRSHEARAALLQEWRRRGVVQCFDWIEPLMPLPLAEVIWIAPPGQPLSLTKRQDQARRHLEAHQETAPRSCGALGQRFHTQTLDALKKRGGAGHPVIATIDLDYFAGMNEAETQEAMDEMFAFLWRCRDLEALTIAISRPYLASDAQANRLLYEALRRILNVANVAIQFEPLATTGPDRSALAKTLRQRGEEPTVFCLPLAGDPLARLLRQHAGQISVRSETGMWQQFLDSIPQCQIRVRGRLADADGRVRIDAGSEGSTRFIDLEIPEQIQPPIEVHWFIRRPAVPSANLASRAAVRKAFAADSPATVRLENHLIKSARDAAPLMVDELRPFFDARTQLGTIRLFASVEVSGSQMLSNTLTISRHAGAGFRGATTENFNLPYVFGCWQLQFDGMTGPEAGHGADCANFLIYGLRRQGYAIPWCNPAQFKSHLEPVGEGRFTEDDLHRGLFVHFGNHVAAVYEDTPPRGVLGASDRLVHHLEGFPEFTSLGHLVKLNPARRDYQLMRRGVKTPAAKIIIGGDVMLGRKVGANIEAKESFDPFVHIRAQLGEADLAVVNLECVLSGMGAPVPGKRHHFRAPIKAARLLASAGIDAVSVGNNHSGDFGPEAARDSLAVLNRAGVRSFGSHPQDVAYFEFHGLKAALVGFSLVEVEAQGEMREEILGVVKGAAEEADFVIVMPHWGREYGAELTEQQTLWARALIRSGADIIAGTHAHHVQRRDAFAGRPIFYGLGNLVFDGPGPNRGWDFGQLLEISLSQGGALQALRLIPVQIQPRTGTPRPMGAGCLRNEE